MMALKILFYVQFAKNIQPKLTKYLEQQMQFYFKHMIKNLVSFLFNVNIAVLSNVAKKKYLIILLK